MKVCTSRFSQLWSSKPQTMPLALGTFWNTPAAGGSSIEGGSVGNGRRVGSLVRKYVVFYIQGLKYKDIQSSVSESWQSVLSVHPDRHQYGGRGDKEEDCAWNAKISDRKAANLDERNVTWRKEREKHSMDDKQPIARPNNFRKHCSHCYLLYLQRRTVVHFHLTRAAPIALGKQSAALATAPPHPPQRLSSAVLCSTPQCKQLKTLWNANTVRKWAYKFYTSNFAKNNCKDKVNNNFAKA